MSMPRIERPENPVDRGQSVNDLIESVALVETGLSHIINAEGEKIQKVIKAGEDVDVPIEDIISVNNSAQRMVNSISKLEMILQNKLDTVKDLDTTDGGGIEPSPIIEESSYLFACAKGTVTTGNVVLPADQVLRDFTANAENNVFTVETTGVYLISFRTSFEESITYTNYVTVNGVMAPPSEMAGTDLNNTSTTTFLYNLTAGDEISLFLDTALTPAPGQQEVSAYLCATRIG